MRPNFLRLGFRGIRVVAAQCAIGLALLGGIEAALRLGTGRPFGVFMGWFPGLEGLYPENAAIVMPGAVNWLVKTNRWGFRGPELALDKPPSTTRIAMIGDSVTDGFCVDNEHTFPAMTAAALERANVRAEVINAAAGGASIDRELAVLRDSISRFSPDIVVLTFVTNDVDALAAIDDAELLGRSLRRRSLARGLARLGVVETALGEWAFDAYLRYSSRSYAANPARVGKLIPPSHRYDFPGGNDFTRNSRIFLDRFRTGDAMILGEELDQAMELQFRRYLRAWDAFVAHARGKGMHPVFVYFPAYPQIYLPAPPMIIRDRLRAHSASQGVPFLDLTEALRSQGEAILHLAPADYHLNPAGNRVIGAALADFLIKVGLVRTAAEAM